ncbi:MAG: hypothetical protein ACK5OX_15905 [Desertimonas sp.]
MLNRYDDLPIHQTSEPLAHPATSDRNFYDRTWFNGYAADGSAYFGIGIAIYPYRKVLDCAFSVVSADGPQHAFLASRLAPPERSETTVGPFRLEIVEPLRRARVILDDNSTGLSCDLTFSTRTAAIQEARQILWDDTRRIMDATRFAQFGRWNGTIGTPDGEWGVTDWHGTKDRSWGVRGVGERETTGAPGGRRSFFFLWAPLFWDDHVSHAVFFDGADGEALVREGLTAPLFDTEDDVPPPAVATDTHAATAAHRITYHPGTRLAASAELDLVDLDGTTRTISFDPLLRFQMKGLGYGHPSWPQGAWQGELAIHGETYDNETLDLLAPENIHVQQVCRVHDGQRTGIGVLEQIVVGPYAPGGFTDMFDGAR